MVIVQSVPRAVVQEQQWVDLERGAQRRVCSGLVRDEMGK